MHHDNITIPSAIADYIDNEVDDYIKHGDTRRTRSHIVRVTLESAYRYIAAGQINDDDIIKKTRCLRRDLVKLRELMPSGEPAPA